MSAQVLPGTDRYDAGGSDLRSRNEARCRNILDSAAPLVTDDLAWASIPHTEVDPGVIECLAYMRDVEGFTERPLVGLTAHRTTHSDPLIRRFIDIWQSEESGHTHALDEFLRRYSERGGAIPSRQMPPPPVAPLRERLLAQVGGPFGDVVAAAHMTWGAANELLTLNGYRLLVQRCGHPVLSQLLTRIAAQEARHYSFYLMQAEWRLAASRLARVVLRRMMLRSWTPVGIGDGYKTHEEFGRVLAYLGRGEQGRRAIDRMDARFAALPGFGDLRIFSAAAAAV